ncbi:MAG: amino acid ABC transporter permease, partial [Ruminococcus sp.]|nr:amino acid ABC transporter permease [Ruminococcus sp.]
ENTGAEKIPGFFDSIALSFEKNFIRENRWELIAKGIGTTCLITVMSAIFGSVLAFLVCMFRRTGSRLANGISNVYVKLLQGTPIVVLLMILYYVVLGKSGLEALWVAVIGFTLNFGAYASEIMRSGIESIDVGQREAALALGYTENQAFFKFIFPQAAVRFLPVYRGEIVSLLKSTSIVGYIAIQDLTKMSDIIRSRTYEAFFPLIATAIIYFVLAWIISLMLKFVLKAVDKRSRKRGTSK